MEGTRRDATSGLRELLLLAGVYLGYSASRVLADDAFAPARARAAVLLDLERMFGLDLEAGLVGWFVDHPWLGLAASFQYASAHYVVTLGVLIWLHVRHRASYARLRTVLMASTAIALACYLAWPTAPPRLVGYADLMALHAGSGWWGEAASAPQGLGWMTNQLAAFPSMHAGWALWVALAVREVSTHPGARALAWAHAGITAVVVVGTGNHWLLDVVAGWLIVLAVHAVIARTRVRHDDVVAVKVALNSRRTTPAVRHVDAPGSLSSREHTPDQTRPAA